MQDLLSRSKWNDGQEDPDIVWPRRPPLSHLDEFSLHVNILSYCYCLHYSGKREKTQSVFWEDTVLPKLNGDELMIHKWKTIKFCLMVLFVHCISGHGTTVHYNLWFISENPHSFACWWCSCISDLGSTAHHKWKPIISHDHWVENRRGKAAVSPSFFPDYCGKKCSNIANKNLNHSLHSCLAVSKVSR